MELDLKVVLTFIVFQLILVDAHIRQINFHVGHTLQKRSNYQRAILHCAILCGHTEDCLGFEVAQCRCSYPRDRCTPTKGSLRYAVSEGISPKVEIADKTVDTEQAGRLLLVSRDRNTHCDYMDLGSWKIHKFTLSKLENVHSMTYLPIAKKIILADSLNQKIISMNIDGSERRELEQIVPEDMIADESVEAIFLVYIFGTKNFLSKMKTNGSKLETLNKGNLPAQHMAVDVVNRVLYVTVRYQVRMYDYKGNTLGDLVGGKSIYGVALDGQGSLYYSFTGARESGSPRFRISKIRLDTREKIDFLKMVSVVRNIIIARGRLYIGTRNKIYFVDLTKEPPKAIKLSDTKSQTIFCILP